MIPLLERLIGIAFFLAVAIPITAAVIWRVRREYHVLVASPEAREIERRTPGLKSVVAGWLSFTVTSIGVLMSAVTARVPVSTRDGWVPIALYVALVPIAAGLVGHGVFRRVSARGMPDATSRLLWVAAHVAIVLFAGVAVALLATVVTLRGGVVE